MSRLRFQPFLFIFSCCFCIGTQIHTSSTNIAGGRLWISVMHRWERLHLLPPKFFFFFPFPLWTIICGMRWLWFCSLEEKCWKKIFTRRNEKNPFFLLPLLSSHKTCDFFIEPRTQVNCCSKISRLLMLLQSTFKDLFSSQLNVDLYFCSLLITWDGFAVVLLHLIWVLFSLGLVLGENSPRLHQNWNCSCHCAPKSVRP